MSRRVPSLTSKKVIKGLERAGFVLHRVKGSHYHFIHPHDDTRLVVVPYHTKDLKRGTIHGIIAQAGLTVDEFLDLL